jgi:hypothetical protein
VAEKHDDASPDDVQPCLLLLQHPVKAATILEHPGKAATILPLAHGLFHPGCEIRGVSLKERAGLGDPVYSFAIGKVFLLDWHTVIIVLASGALI